MKGSRKMLSADAKDDVVTIKKMEGAEERLICDIGMIAHKTMLIIASNGAKSAEEVFLRYGVLARKLTNYIEMTVQRISEMEN